MAGKLGAIYISIVARMGAFKRDLATARTTSLQTSQRMVRHFSMVKASIIGLAGAAGMGLLIRSVIRTGAQFQQSMATVRGVMRATSKEFDALEKIAKKMGATTEWTASQAAESLKFLGMAGFNAGKAIKALPGTLDLATAGNIALGQAADIATNALTAMQLDVSELGRVNDVFVGTITRSNTNMEMMAESFRYAAPVAKAYGISIERLSALIGILGNAGVQGCYDGETEVLTEDGWKYWEDVTRVDNFATVDPESKKIEYNKPTELIKYHYSGKMYHVETQRVDLLVTPNHNMFVDLYRTTNAGNYKLCRADKIAGRPVKYLASFKWEGEDAKNIILPGFIQNRASWKKIIPDATIPAEVFMEFLGYYLSEGSCDLRRGNYRIRITQKNAEGRNKIRECLKRMPFSFSENSDGFQITNQQLYNYVLPFGKCDKKYIPKDIKKLSSRLLEILYQALVVGDGDSNGAVYSVSKRLIDDISEICLKFGRGVSVSTCGKHCGFIKGRAVKSIRTCYKINVRDSYLTPSMDPSEYVGVHGTKKNHTRGARGDSWEDFDGMVYCAEVPPNHVLIVRRNGKIIASGNSMAGTQLAFGFQKAARVFKELGIDGTGKDVVDALEAANEAGWDAAKMMQVFGMRGGRAALILRGLIPQVREFESTLYGVGGESKQLADIMRSTVAGAFTELKSVIESIAVEAFTEQSSSLEDSIRELSKTIRENKDGIIDFFSTLISLSTKVAGAAGAFGRLFEEMSLDIEAAKWQRLGKLDWNEFQALNLKERRLFIEGLKRRYEVSDRDFDEINAENERKIIDLVGNIDAALRKAFDSIDYYAIDEALKKAFEVVDLSEAMQIDKAIDKFFKDIDEVEAALGALSGKKRGVAFRPEILVEASKIKAAHDKIENILNPIEGKIDLSLEGFFRDVDVAEEALGELFQSEKLETLDARIASVFSSIDNELDNLNEKTNIAVDIDLDNFFRDLDEAEEGFKKTTDYMLVLSERTSNAMEQTFSDFFFDAMQGEMKSFEDYMVGVFDSMSRAFSDILGQMLADWIKTQLSMKSVAASGSGFGSVWSWITGLLGGGKTATPVLPQEFIGLGGGQFAKGGIIDKPTIFPFASGIGLAGESGPEGILPLKRIGGNLGVSAEGTGSTINKYDISIHAVDAASFNELLERNPEAIISQITNAADARHGGLRQSIRDVIR